MCILGSFNALLRELVAEFTLTDNSANTTTSLLRSLCHYDDSVLLGSWLQETDHKSIEDQVGKYTRKQKHQHNLKQGPMIHCHVKRREPVPQRLSIHFRILEVTGAEKADSSHRIQQSVSFQYHCI